MYRAGLRVSEVVALRPRDITDEGAVHVWEGKGGVDRTSYFDPARVWPWVERWLVARARVGANDNDPLICRYGGKPLSTRSVQLGVKEYRMRAGITSHLTPHTLRHSYASELLEEGFNTREVQELLGHASVATTELYTHVVESRLAERVRGRASGTIVT